MDIKNSMLLANMMSGNKSKGTLNATVVGNPTITDDFIVSGFSQESIQSSNGNYLIIPTTQEYTQNWEFVIKIRFPSIPNQTSMFLSRHEEVNLGITAGVSSSGRLAGWGSSGSSVSANTWYWVKFSFGTTSISQLQSISTDGINFINGTSGNGNLTKFGLNQFIGRTQRNNNYAYIAFNGEVDMKETYLKANDEIVWKGVI